jgi:hypothetical protein
MTAIATVIGWVVIYSALMLGFLLLAEAILRRQARPRRAQDYDLFPVQPVTWDLFAVPDSAAWADGWKHALRREQAQRERHNLIAIEADSPLKAWEKLEGK